MNRAPVQRKWTPHEYGWFGLFCVIMAAIALLLLKSEEPNSDQYLFGETGIRMVEYAMVAVFVAGVVTALVGFVKAVRAGHLWR